MMRLSTLFTSPSKLTMNTKDAVIPSKVKILRDDFSVVATATSRHIPTDSPD